MRVVALPLLLLLGVACGSATVAKPLVPPQAFAPAHAAPSFNDPDRHSRLAATFEKLDAYFARFHERTRAPGVVVGLVDDKSLLWSKGYGVLDLRSKAPVDIDSVFRIGSITKMFTAATAVRLRDEGKLAFGAPVTSYLPEFADVLYPTTDSARIKVEHLVEHTGGVIDIGDPGSEGIGDDKHTPTDASLLGSLRGMHLLSPPGETWSYSGVGYGLLGLAIARVYGRPYRDTVTELILRPLAMNSTVWEPDASAKGRLATAYEPKDDNSLSAVEPWKFGAMDPAGGLYSTLRDMARFVEFQLDAWPARSDTETGPVARSSLREMHRPVAFERVITSREAATNAIVRGYGIGWQSAYICGLGLEIACSGGTEGQTAFIFALPERGVGAVVLTNVRDVSWRGVAQDVWKILDDGGALTPRSLGSKPDAGRPHDDRFCPN